MHRTLTMAIACLPLAGFAAAQDEPENSIGEQPKSLSLGDDAPELRIMEWVKGDPVSEFEEGHVYAVEFWATWCGPCIVGMPHLSELQDRFDGEATIISVTKADPSNTFDTVTEFVAQNDEKMRYHVAFDDLDLTWTSYMTAADQSGIPCAFVIDKEGRLVWIGHPADPVFERTIDELIEDRFDLELAREAWAKEAEAKRAASRAREESAVLIAALNTAWETGERERALEIADELVALGPESMFNWAWWKFEALMVGIGDQPRAYEYVREVTDAHYRENADLLLRFVYGIADSIGVENPDLDLAFELVDRAAELTNRQDPRVLSTLAMVQMQRKAYDEGIAAMKRAIDLATTPQMRAALEGELEWYEFEKQMAERRDGGG